jgi:tripartite-type tricarboxylate transporter receptor subunit TctC
MKERNLYRGLLATLIAGIVVGSAFADVHAAEPLKGPIRMIVGYAPGNSADSIARLLAQKMTISLGVPVYVDNRVGAGARIAVDLLKNAPPDGKTIMVGTFSVMAIFPMIFTKTTYHLSDFQPVADIANSNVVIAAPIDAPYKTLPEYAAWLTKNPTRAQIGNEAAGSPAHLLGVELGRLIGVDTTFVPYKNATQLISDLIGKQIPAATFSLPTVYKLHQGKQLRILAIGSDQRTPNAPELPTFKEAGFNLSVNSFYGAWMPSKTPLPIVDQMSRAIVDAVAQPDVQQRFRLLGLDPTGKGRAEFTKISEEQEKSWRQIVKNTGFRIDD